MRCGTPRICSITGSGTDLQSLKYAASFFPRRANKYPNTVVLPCGTGNGVNNVSPSLNGSMMMFGTGFTYPGKRFSPLKAKMKTRCRSCIVVSDPYTGSGAPPGQNGRRSSKPIMGSVGEGGNTRA